MRAQEVGVLPILIRVCACSLLILISGTARSTTLSSEVDVCDQPEPCFQAAALPKERLGNALTKEQVLVLKLERLQRLMERFPDSLRDA